MHNYNCDLPLLTLLQNNVTTYNNITFAIPVNIYIDEVFNTMFHDLLKSQTFVNNLDTNQKINFPTFGIFFF